MQVEFLQTSDASVEHKIKSCLEWCHTANFGVAYASYKAYTIFQKDFERFLRQNGRLKVLFDVDKVITSPQIIKQFSEIPGDCECKIYATPTDAKTHDTFHPKFYFFSNDIQFSVIIGSSNFTQGGIQKNIEANVCVTGVYAKDNDGSEDLSFYKDVTGYFKKIWANEYAVNVLDYPDFLKDYIEHHKKHLKQSKKTESDQKKLKEALGKKAKAVNQKRKQPLSENFAYLLGLLTMKGELDLAKNELRILLKRGLVHRGKEHEGYYHYPEIGSDYKISQKEAHDRDIEKISDRLLDLLIAFSPNDIIDNEKSDNGLSNRIIITFSNNSSLLKELKKYNFQLNKNKIIPRIPTEIVTSDNNIIKYFLKGCCDLQARLSPAGYATPKTNGEYSELRMGLQLPKNPDLTRGLVALFRKIGIDLGDPNERENKEHQIRINVNHIPYDLMGTHWRRILLKDFQDYINNRKKKT